MTSISELVKSLLLFYIVTRLSLLSYIYYENGFSYKAFGLLQANFSYCMYARGIGAAIECSTDYDSKHGLAFVLVWYTVSEN